MNMIKEWIEEIAERDMSQKPHFILTPMGDEYNTLGIIYIIILLLVAEYIYKKYGEFGFNTYVIGSCAPSDAYKEIYKYMMTPLMKTDETATATIEYFEKRLKYHKWVILSDTKTMDYSYKAVSSLVSEFKNIMKQPMQLLLKRCTSQVYIIILIFIDK